MVFVPRQPLPHEVPPWVKSGSLYFFTLCAADRAHAALTAPDRAAVLLNAARHYHDKGRWFVRIFLLMPDHLHALIVFPSAESIKSCWRDWKRFTAKNADVVWQRDFFEHRIRNDENWQEKSDYIRANPVRQGLVSDATLWPWIFENT